MSVYTYFCYCCMSTNDLTNMFTENKAESYSDMLIFCLSIQISKSDFYETDCYICGECAVRLQNATNFKRQVLTTIEVLHGNGLLGTKTDDGLLVVCKSQTEDLLNHNFDSVQLTQTLEEYECIEYIDEELLQSDIEYRYLKEHALNGTKAIKTEDKVYSDVKCRKKKSKRSVRKAEKAILEASEIKLEPKTEYVESDNSFPVKRKGVKKRKKQLPYAVNAETLQCDHCEEVMPNLRTFHIHMNVHFPNHVCETCGKGFVNEMQLKRHVTSHASGLFTCAQCGQCFEKANSLQSHRLRKHRNAMYYKCPRCDARFDTWHKRTTHAAVVHGMDDKKYKCHICPMKFLVSGNLSSHIRRTHLKVKRHMCTYCDAGFFQKQELEGHLSQHTGLRKHKCSVCQKSYPRRRSLLQHMRIHNNDKRYCCAVCGRRFVQNATLKCHMRVHEKERLAAQAVEDDSGELAEDSN